MASWSYGTVKSAIQTAVGVLYAAHPAECVGLYVAMGYPGTGPVYLTVDMGAGDVLVGQAWGVAEDPADPEAGPDPYLEDEQPVSQIIKQLIATHVAWADSGHVSGDSNPGWGLFTTGGVAAVVDVDAAVLAPGAAGQVLAWTGSKWEPKSAGSIATSFLDTDLEVKDDGDPTRVADFQCSLIAAGTRRTFSFPDKSGTFLLTDHLSDFAHGDIASNSAHRGLTSGNPHGVTPADLSLVIGTNVQAQNAVLQAIADTWKTTADASTREFILHSVGGISSDPDDVVFRMREYGYGTTNTHGMYLGTWGDEHEGRIGYNDGSSDVLALRLTDGELEFWAGGYRKVLIDHGSGLIHVNPDEYDYDLKVGWDSGTALEVRGSSGSVEVGSSLGSPFGGFGRYSNRLKYSEEFDNGEWTKDPGDGTATITANDTTAPNGEQTADKVTWTYSSNPIVMRQDNLSTALENSTTYTFSCWLKLVSGEATFGVDFGDNATTPTVEMDTTWRRYTFTATTGSSGTSNHVDLDVGASSVFYIWGAQLVEGSDPQVYCHTGGDSVDVEQIGYCHPDRTLRYYRASSYQAVANTATWVNFPTAGFYGTGWSVSGTSNTTFTASRAGRVRVKACTGGTIVTGDAYGGVAVAVNGTRKQETQVDYGGEYTQEDRLIGTFVEWEGDVAASDYIQIYVDETAGVGGAYRIYYAWITCEYVDP